MSRPEVVLYKSVPPDVRARLAEAFTLSEFKGVNDGNRAEFAAALHRADGAIGVGMNVTPALLDAAPKLRAWATISVGYDPFDVPDLTRRGIVLMNTPDVLTETTADTVFSLILASARRVVELAELVKAGGWTSSLGEAYFGTDVQGKTLGIVGMGRIGGAVARRAALGFGMKVLYSNRSRNGAAEQAYGAQYRTLPELLAQADFVVTLVPLSPATERLIGAREFAQMKRGAIFVNAARGMVIDEAALVDALASGHLRAAGLDVFEREPVPVDSPLLKMKNVVALPHIGSATHETRHAMASCAADNLIAALTGKPLQNAVNPQAQQRG
ncbi:NAD(P)-dependent oxidoreductase [Pandoraea communis]|uniref:Glyoxylate/hydroxypyruvate reductase B n=1 Tax=Pandoraea communis TaxID=2508297 RepID=A0A5E4R725_9BURK|nr:NAD(P)-dependent oxidoreductase [Pandoraea communis]MDM8355960.1 NAD(P)-dependent oxidoreductase [Pandoraea communis]VVD59150.1 2-ketogluconate 6-phosphate reductase [Pandoraea communis]